MSPDTVPPKMADRQILPDRLKLFRSAIQGHRGEMLTGAFGTLVLRCGAAVFAFLATVILARDLGASGYGTYAWAIAWASVLQIATTFGFDTLAIRELPRIKLPLHGQPCAGCSEQGL